MSAPPLLRVESVTKSYPGVRALDGVSLDLSAGEIVAVVGQNGSGKSTLVKVLAGLVEPDSGKVTLALGDDQGPPEAGTMNTALHFTHQDLGILAGMTTVENLYAARTGGMLLPRRRREERERAERLIASLGASFDVTLRASRLTPAERSIVAIARALDGWVTPRNVLVLDEPTAALEGAEVGKLFNAVRAVVERGAGVLFISHRLDEVMQLADRVVALRDGRVVADAPRATIDHDALVRMIVGHALDDEVVQRAGPAGDVVLSVQDLRGAAVDGVDLRVRTGEVVGVSGVLGSGREHLCGLLSGAIPRTGGQVVVDGAPLATEDPREAIDRGVAFIPADRHRDGAVMNMSVRENFSLPWLRSLRMPFGRLDRRREGQEVEAWLDAVALRPREPNRRLALFSGGNQQKIVIGKWLRNKPKVLLMDEPTQGVDVGAKASIYELVGRAAGDGAGVVVSSSDTKELALLCDRVLVLRDGTVAVEVPQSARSEEHLVRESLRLTDEAELHMAGTESPVAPS